MALADLILAPVRGITDRVYREASARCFGTFDRAVAPFVKLRKDQLLLPADRVQLSLTPPVLMKTIPQVHTNHGPSFLQGLHELHELGYDEVNWNLGCPYPMVAKRQRGAGLLPHPERINAILDEVVAKSPVKLSVKIRLGYHTPDELWAVLDVLNQFPLTEVILHPRTADQMYGGEVDLDRAVAAFRACRHPFVYNGDIVSSESFRRVQQLMPDASGWMLGRGALMNPFLPGLLKGDIPRDREPVEVVFWRFHRELVEGYMGALNNTGNVGLKMKAHWVYLAHCFDAPPAIYKPIKRCRTWQDYTETIDSLQEHAFAEGVTD